MRMKLALGLWAALTAASAANAAVVINEFLYDDGGTDDREFVELYNDNEVPADISGWTLGGHDGSTTQNNPTITIPGAAGSGTTVIPAGGYYVIGFGSVPNVNQTVTALFENSGESIELYDGAFETSNLQDAVVYEGYFGGTGTADDYGTLTAAVQAQVNDGPVWGILAPADSATAGLTGVTMARWTDGRDTNNNGRDFGLRRSSPGAANATTTTTAYVAPNVDAAADGDVVAGYASSFVGLRAMTPGVVVEGLNQNAITAPIPGGATKALTAWDGSGGGNAIVSNDTFAGGAKSFDLSVYIDTEDLPQSFNASNVNFTGSEVSFFGLGTIDGNVGGGAANLSNLSGAVRSDAANAAVGLTGVAWYYEKVQLGASEKLYLVDAGDGGDSNTAVANTTPEGWTILQTIDLAGNAAGTSDWQRLSIEIDAAGNGVARFGEQSFNFTTTPGDYGAMTIGYRENTQEGADGTPGYLRPPTFVQFASGATDDDADFNDDTFVNGEDFLIWQRGFGGPGNDDTGDSTGDGQVTGLDFDEWASTFGNPAATAAGGAVPEPASLVAGLIALAALKTAARTRR